MARAIVMLAHDRDLRVVASGIEEPARVVFLPSTPCDLAWGFLFSRPLEAAAAERFARDAAAGRAAV